MSKRNFLLIIAALFLSFSSYAQNEQLKKDAIPFFGAQIFIEPGQTQPQIESWFKTLSENGMTVCRIRMFESYMLQPDGNWDFTLFDYAFRAADKHGIKVYATLFPATEKTDIGGWKFPKDEEQKAAFSRYIRALVTHYKDYSSLYGWVIINEPGTDGHYPQTDFFQSARMQWEEAHPIRDFKENGFPILMTTRDKEFLNEFTTGFLGWIAGEIRKYDTSHDIHVNPAAVFSNYGEYDFPSWRHFLTSLGGSAHPSWHFGYFTRQQYSLAMLALAEILRSGAGNMPWFMTEIQGGNNTYSGGNAMCPTSEEIAQWLWIVLGCEGKGGIFWMLNPRSSGIEAGEWAMIDFQGKPSERLTSAKEVSKVVSSHADIFRNPRIIPSDIDVVYIKESLWAENLMGKSHDPCQGRNHGAVIKSSIACFRALTERGLNVGLKEMNEYDFSQADYTGRSIVIANQISIPIGYRKNLETFVSRGGTLFVEGLSAFFDEDLHNTMNTGFTFERLFGGNISEFILKDDLFTINAGKHKLPVHLWQGKIADKTVPVSEHSFGKGRVIWFPSNIALGAWVSNDFKSLSDYLYETLPKSTKVLSFGKHHENVLLRTLETDKGKLLICVNKSKEKETITLNNLTETKKLVPIYARPDCSVTGNKITMYPDGILVMTL